MKASDSSQPLILGKGFGGGFGGGIVIFLIVIFLIVIFLINVINNRIMDIVSKDIKSLRVICHALPVDVINVELSVDFGVGVVKSLFFFC